MDEKNQKNKMEKKTGNKSLYKTEYCQMLIEHMKKGLSFSSFAAICGVKRLALYDWAKKYPEFEEAKEIGRAYSLLFWERLGIQAATGQVNGFNATAFVFCLKNMHGWRDKVDIDNQTTITHKIDSEKVKELPTEKIIEEYFERLRAH